MPVAVKMGRSTCPGRPRLAEEVQLAGGGEMATQFWVFRSDGTAAVKEVPDRGEKQNAVPVKGTGLQKP